MLIIELFPKEPRCYLNRSAVYLGAEDLFWVFANVEEAVGLRLTWPKEYFHKESVLLRFKNYGECIKTCKIGKCHIPFPHSKLSPLYQPMKQALHNISCIQANTSTRIFYSPILSL